MGYPMYYAIYSKGAYDGNVDGPNVERTTIVTDSVDGVIEAIEEDGSDPRNEIIAVYIMVNVFSKDKKNAPVENPDVAIEYFTDLKNGGTP